MRHVDVELLMLVLEGQLPPGTLLRMIVEHLKELCPECRSSLASLQRGSNEGELLEGDGVAALTDHLVRSTGGDPRYVAAFAGAESSVAAWARRLREEQRAARRDLSTLLELPPERRARRVANARTRFRSRSLAELLVAECRRQTPRDPERARQLAELVPLVLAVVPGAAGASWAGALSQSALAWRANALRLLGRLQEADRAFAGVRAALARSAVDNALLHADVCSLEASLRIDQGRLGDARHLLDRSVLLFRQEGDSSEVARVLMKRGIVERREGEAATAIATQREVLALLDPTEESYLFVSAIGNLALALCDAERFAEAAELIAAHEALYRRHESPRWLVKESVLRGRIAHGLGRAQEAEGLFRDARDRAMEQRDFFSASLASLELATLFLEQGRSRELREVAALLGPVFEAHDLRQEATAALLLFTRAALSEEISAETVRRLRWKLEVGGRAGAQPAVS